MNSSLITGARGPDFGDASGNRKNVREEEIFYRIIRSGN